MEASLYVGKTGLEALSTQMNTTSNNIANSQTNGFKAGRANFATLMTREIRPTSNVEGGAPSGVHLGTGVTVTSVDQDFATGAPQNTGRELDVMISGDGFFTVEKEDGETYYTRAGNLTRDEDGRLITQDNIPIQPEITIADDAVSIKIDRDGTVSTLAGGDEDYQEVGQLDLVRFINPQGLTPIGDNLFKETETSGDPLYGTAGEFGYGEILQGYVEGSNVNMGEQLVKLIEIQNAYEMNSKVITKTGEMMQNATDQLG